MTTTKKKAKAVTLRDRVESLETDRLALLAAASSMKQRLTALEDVGCVVDDIGVRLTAVEVGLHVVRHGALEQAQRPAEKPATEKRAGPWESAGRHAHRKCTKGMPVCAVETLFSGQWQAWAVNADSQVTHWWGTQYSTEADARAACDAELARLGWTLDESPPDLWEEDRLRDAVVDAALAYAGGGAALEGLNKAARALRAHRAKKGGVT